MLVLTRKVQEQIKVGNDITITIIRVKGQSVRVGIEAPRDVRVMRSELSEGRVNDLSAEPLTHETDASVPARHEESMHDESLAPNPDRAESEVPLTISNRLTSGVQQETAGEVVGPRRLVAPRTGPLSKRVTRQAVVEMLELAN